MNKRILCLLGFVILLSFIYAEPASAQRRKRKQAKTTSIYDIDTLRSAIPRQRQIFHERIDKEQRRADVSDGAVDKVIYYSEDTAFTSLLTRAILRDVDQLQVMIENMPAMSMDMVGDNQMRIRYLTAVWELMRKYNADTHIDPYYYRRLVTNMREMLIAVNTNALMDFAKSNMNIYTLDNGKVLFEEYPEVRSYVYTQMGKRDPKMMIKRLAEYANDAFADVIIADAARVVPNELFNFASSTNYPLRNAVRRNTDPLVQTIVKIADRSKSPLKAMPFLNDIHTGHKTIAQIDAIANNPDEYYQNLVRLKVENIQLGSSTYSDELAYRALKYVREMNDLHESSDAVRFKCIDGMAPVSLYFIMVYGQDEIYTSSFLGTFKRMMERMKPMKGDQLLDTLHYDHFRTFIRMCAGYNTLSDFLVTIDEDKKTKLMSDFIANLGKGKDEDLEDAVDVADAFGSIKDSILASFLQNKVKENYEVAYKEGSKKGLIVYSLLSLLFDGVQNANSDAGAAHQSERLGLPPINIVPYKALLGDTNVVVEQFFFFGDEDGKSSYASFMGNFRDGKWKTTTDKYWVTITSTTGNPVVIYANLPLSEPQDEEAQNQLVNYLAQRNIKPTIMVHRGHSYHLPITMDKLTKNAKVVMLGSCGGYHNLATVLDRSPSAHIISSKQTGMMSINEPIIKSINDRMLSGSDINWITMWNDLDTYFSKKKTINEKFSDYVPPYKNLGAIFIKAYRRMLNAEEESNS